MKLKLPASADTKIIIGLLLGFCSSTILHHALLSKQELLHTGSSIPPPPPPPPRRSRTNKHASNRVADKTKDVFQFSRGLTQLLLEAAYATDENNSLFYTEEELHVIQRSIYTLLGLTSIGLWSSAHGEQHFFGTASCLIKLKRPAMEVALGVLHGIYLKQWRNHVYEQGWEECDQRYVLRQLLGSEMESFLWMETGSGATGPWETCVDVWQKLVDQQQYNAKIKAFVDSTPIAFQLCDEMDEVMGGDAMLGGNWKRRSNDFYEQMMHLAHSMELHSLEPQLQAAMDFANAIFPTHPAKSFKQLRPSNHTYLFRSVDISHDAHPEDLARYSFLHQQGRQDRQLLPLYKGTQMQPSLVSGIAKARDLCDAASNETMSLDAYIDEMEALKKDLAYCEHHGPHYFVNSATVSRLPPRKVPDFAIPDEVPYYIKPRDPKHRVNYLYRPKQEQELLELQLQQHK